jgi:hypothetical protein
MKIATINKILVLSWVYLLLWVVYQLGLNNGYKDAENDLIKKGYDFNNVKRAFK